MKKHQQAVFFDIDGTLWDVHNHIPESTAAALRALKENGHRIFLCTGRTRSFIQDPTLLALGFDGIVSGCGTMIEYGGETVFYRPIPHEDAVFAMEAARRYGFRPMLEGPEYLYFDEEDFPGDWYAAKVRRELGPRHRRLTDHWGTWEINKFSCDTRGCDQAAGLAAMAPVFEPIIHNENVVEVVPAGFGKGSGIRMLCGIAGIDLLDTVCFGDGANDVDMFAACARSVAMGDGAEKAMRAAGYVTPPLDQDGIWNGCNALGLI